MNFNESQKSMWHRFALMAGLGVQPQSEAEKSIANRRKRLMKLIVRQLEAEARK
jgi:HD superfamily phosphodiesterase